MTFSNRGRLSYLVAMLFAASCGPHVGGLVVERWSPLAEGAWSLEPGTEDAAWCSETVLEADTYIAAIRPAISSGTHHIALNLASSDDDGGCNGGRFGPETIYAAGPGTSEIRLPPGVAMRLRAGQRLRLNLHVYNSTSQRLDGLSGIEILRAERDAVKDEAAFVLAGPDKILLPPRQRTTVTQSCRFTSDQTAFALIPLMHKLGVQFSATVQRGNESTVLYDGAFQFEEQSQLALGSLAVHAGDAITVACTYDNPTYGFVTKGHAGGEICYSALLREPSDASIDCSSPDAASVR